MKNYNWKWRDKKFWQYFFPAIVAGGFLMGIMEALNFMVNNNFIAIETTSSVYVFAKLFSNVAYIFLGYFFA